MNKSENSISRYTATQSVSEVETLESEENMELTQKNIVRELEKYINGYVAFRDPQYSLVIALWVLGTYCFQEFDAFPYLSITSSTKRSGKTRTSEVIGFCCSNPRNMSSLTPAVFFRLIEQEHPTMIIDEAEELNSEKSIFREVLNVGYRRGQTISRCGAGDSIKDYQTYTPKIFVLIGDVYATLRDRSIIVYMQRATPKKLFIYKAAQEEGKILRSACSTLVKDNLGMIEKTFNNHERLSFFSSDRDSEIWTSLFVMARIFCPDRIAELTAAASDMAAEKTGTSRKYTDLEKAETEKKATNEEYARKALTDLWSLFAANGITAIKSDEAIELMKQIPAAPWRKFRTSGLTRDDLAAILKPFKCGPHQFGIGSGRGRPVARGYRRKDIERAMSAL